MRNAFFIFGILLFFLGCESKPKNIKLFELSYSDELKNNFSFVMFNDRYFILRQEKNDVIGGYISHSNFDDFEENVREIQNIKAKNNNCNNCKILSLKIVEDNNDIIRILQKNKIDKKLLRIIKDIENITKKPEKKFYLKLVYQFETLNDIQ